MKQSIKFASIFFLIGLFLGIIYFMSLGSKTLENEINIQLSEVLNQRGHLIETFLNDQKQKILKISEEGIFRKFLENPDQRENLLGNINDTFFKNIREDPFIDEMFILSPQGDMLVNTQSGYTPPDIFKEFDYSVEKEGQAYVKPIRFCYCVEQYVFDVTTPLYDNKTGDIIGLVVIRTYASNLADLIGGQRGLRDLERVYLVNDHGLLISSSILFQEKQRNFIQNADNENARKCFGERKDKDHVSQKEFINPFSNYLGEKVVGVYKYFSEPEWCLLVEEDANNIYSIPRRNSLIKNSIAIFILIVIFGVLGYFIGRYFDKKRKRR